MKNKFVLVCFRRYSEQLVHINSDLQNMSRLLSTWLSFCGPYFCVKVPLELLENEDFYTIHSRIITQELPGLFKGDYSKKFLWYLSGLRAEFPKIKGCIWL